MKHTSTRYFLWLLLLCAIVAAIMGIAWQRFLQSPLNIPATGITYTLAPGTSAVAFVNDLKQRDIVQSPRFFRWLLRMQSAGRGIHAGDYYFAAGSTPTVVIKKVLKGDIIHYQLRLGEGWTFRQIMDAVNKDTRLIHTLNDLTTDAIMVRLGHANENPEGLFFPDTYETTRQMTDVQFLNRAYQKMTKQVQTAWLQRSPDVPYQTAYQALIIASLVEKETAKPDERAIIAGVLLKRWQSNIRLQVDPSVIYGLGDRYTGTLTRKDLQQDNPYNTYTRPGLPPTPIATVSLASLQAVLHPKATNWLYYVANGLGGHSFSTTLAEHEKAVAHYRTLQTSQIKTHNLGRLCVQGEDKLWSNPNINADCLSAWKVLKGLANQLKYHLFENTYIPAS